MQCCQHCNVFAIDARLVIFSAECNTGRPAVAVNTAKGSNGSERSPYFSIFQGGQRLRPFIVAMHCILDWIESLIAADGDKYAISQNWLVFAALFWF